MIKKNKKDIYSITWQDAAFSYRKNIPKKMPDPSISVGLIVDNKKDHISIAQNFNEKQNGNIHIIDGIVIPKKTIIKMKKIK